jgi:mitogen-activated protein kinase organizer 1
MNMEILEEPAVKIDCKQGLIKAVRFNKDGQYAITCGSDRTIKLWRPSKLLQLKCYRGHSAEVVDGETKQDNSQFISCSNDKSVIVWDVENGKILRRFRNLAPFNTICYGHDATTVFAGSLDGAVRIYDLRAVNAWEPIQNLIEASDSITCCRVSKHLVFTTSTDKCLRTYDIRQGKLAIDTMSVPLNHVSIGQEASTLLVSCLRGSVLLVDRRESGILNEYCGNDNKLFKIESSFAMKDTLVVAGSENGQVYVWDSLNKEPKLALKHSGITPPIIQSISSDTLDNLLTACSNHMFMWSLS